MLQRKSYKNIPALSLESLGALSAVYVDSVVRDKNLDYLQYLCSLCQSMNLNYLWFSKETLENKKKLLLIFQLCINYSNNLQKSYSQQKIDLEKDLRKKKEQLKAKKNEVKEHRNSVYKLKEKFKANKMRKIKGNYNDYLNKMKEMEIYYQQQKIKVRQQQKLFQQQSLRQFMQFQQTQKCFQQTYPFPNYPASFMNPMYQNSPIQTSRQQYSPPYPPQQGYFAGLNPGYPPSNPSNPYPPVYKKAVPNEDRNPNDIPKKKQDKLANVSISSEKPNLNNIHTSTIIAKNDQMFQETPKNDFKFSKHESSYGLSEKNDTIGEILDITKKHNKGGNQSSIKPQQSDLYYNQHLDSINNINLLPNSGISPELPIHSPREKKDQFQQTDHLDLLQSKITKSRPQESDSSKIKKPYGHFGSKIHPNSEQLGSSNQGYTAQQSHFNGKLKGIHSNYDLSRSNQGGEETYFAKKPQKKSQKQQQLKVFNSNPKKQQNKTNQNITNFEDIDLYNSGIKNKGNNKNQSRKKKGQQDLQDQSKMKITINPPIQEGNKEYEQEQEYAEDFENIGEQSVRPTSKQIVGNENKQIENSKSASIQSKFAEIQKRQLIPNETFQKKSTMSESLIGSLKQHTKKSQQIQSDSDDLFGDMIDMPQNSIIARPPPRVVSNLPPKNLGKSNKDSMNNLELTKGKSQAQKKKDSELLQIPGSTIKKRSDKKNEQKILRQKVPGDLANSTTINEDQKNQNNHKYQNQANRYDVPERQQNNELSQIIEVVDQSHFSHQKQQIETNILSLIRKKPENIPNLKSKNFNPNLLEIQLKSKFKITSINEIEDWESVQKFYSQKYKELEKIVEQKKQANELILKDKSVKKSNYQKMDQSQVDDLTYSRSLLDPSFVPESLSNKKSKVQTQDTEKLKNQKNSQKQISKKEPIQEKPNRNSSFARENSKQKTEKILGKIEEKHKYDIEDDLENAIRGNKNLFKQPKLKPEDESDW